MVGGIPLLAFRALFRLASASVMAYGFRSLGTLGDIDILIRNQYGGHLQYLTIQGLIIAFCTMLIGVVTDVIPPLRPLLRSTRRSLFIAAMPLAVIISSIYWTLLTFFPNLIIQADLGVPSTPTSSDAAPVPFRLPLRIDLALHAAPALSLLFDFFAFESKYSHREVNVHVPVVVALYAIFYGTWVEYCAGKNDGVFPYPFLTHSPLEIRVFIYIASALLAFLSFGFLNKIHPRR